MKRGGLSALVFLVPFLFFVVSPQAEQKRNVDWQITVDLTDSASGLARVDMLLSRHSGRDIYLRKMARSAEIGFSDVQVETSAGRSLDFRLQNNLIRLSGEVANSESITVRYTVRPGGIGRHGHQGYIGKDFASFDGRIILMPNNSRDLVDIRMRVAAPEEWQVITPHRKQGQWYYPDQFSKQLAAKSLLKSCIAAGRFDVQRQLFGDTEVGVYSFASWPQEYKARITRKSLAMYNYFFERFGFNPGSDFVVVWTPRSEQNKRIWSAVWSNGMCYEMPTETIRNWELFAHRVAHPMNEYQPSGMSIRDRSDHWFLEGWASYIEVVAVVDLGFAPEAERWGRLYDRYVKTMASNPEFDMPLVNESSAEGASKEFIHYVKAPLVMKMLDAHLRLNSEIDLDKFMRYAYKKYGHFNGNFPVLEELESFSGFSLQAFWEQMVRRKGVVVPIWRSQYHNPDASKVLSESAAWINGKAVSGAYLFEVARSGEVQRFADVVPFIAEEIQRRELLSNGALVLYPQQVKDNISALPASSRVLLARYESLYMNAVPVSEIEYQINMDSEDGRTFSRLLELELQYERQRATPGARGLSLKIANNYRLGFLPGDSLKLHTQWWQGGVNARFELLSPSAEVVEARSMSVQPGWSNTYNSFSVRREATPGIWTFRVMDGQKELLRRAFWQRHEDD